MKLREIQWWREYKPTTSGLLDQRRSRSDNQATYLYL